MQLSEKVGQNLHYAKHLWAKARECEINSNEFRAKDLNGFFCGATLMSLVNQGVIELVATKIETVQFEEEGLFYNGSHSLHRWEFNRLSEEEKKQCTKTRKRTVKHFYNVYKMVAFNPKDYLNKLVIEAEKSLKEYDRAFGDAFPS